MLCKSCSKLAKPLFTGTKFIGIIVILKKMLLLHIVRLHIWRKVISYHDYKYSRLYVSESEIIIIFYIRSYFFVQQYLHIVNQFIVNRFYHLMWNSFFRKSSGDNSDSSLYKLFSCSWWIHCIPYSGNSPQFFSRDLTAVYKLDCCVTRYLVL